MTAVVVAVLVLATGPVLALDDEGATPSDDAVGGITSAADLGAWAGPGTGAPCEPEHVPHLGPACPLSDGHYLVVLDDGTLLRTHGPDPVPPPGDVGFGTDDDQRAPVCALDSRIHVLYGHPESEENRAAEVADDLRAAVRRMNAVLHADGLESGGVGPDYRVACDEDGRIAVDAFAGPETGGDTYSSDFAAVVNAARQAGYDEVGTNYLIFYDARSPGVCGTGNLARDDRASEDNRNLWGPDYGVTYQPCWTGRTPMHENGHNMGAVQRFAPMSDFTAHCQEGGDVMCYSYPTSNIFRCTDRIHFDCNHDTYFHTAPESGSWLAEHWNLGSPLNRYLAFHDGEPGSFVAEGGVERVTVFGAEPGATVTLYLAEDPAAPDPATDAVVASATASTTGTASFVDLAPGPGYYATQSDEGEEGPPTDVVSVRPPAPVADGGTENVTVTGYYEGATVRLYGPDDGLVALVANATGPSVVFSDIPAGTGYAAAQAVQEVEGPQSEPVNVAPADARTPDDAMPGHEPVETGGGSAKYEIEGRTDLAVNALFSRVDGDEYSFPLRLHGDETLVEVRLTWESERTDLNLIVRDPDHRAVATSLHGQAFVNQFCGLVGECIFVFPPNGATAEYVALQRDDQLFEGTGSINVTERNNWNEDDVAAWAGLADGPTFTLEVWVYTVPAEPTHDPFA